MMEVHEAPDRSLRETYAVPVFNPAELPTWLKQELSIPFPVGDRRRLLFIAGCQLRRAGYDRETAIAVGATTIKLECPVSKEDFERQIKRGWAYQNEKASDGFCRDRGPTEPLAKG
jgi:hypothetical protein